MPQHPKQDYWRARAHELLAKISDNALSVEIGCVVPGVDLHFGDFASADAELERMNVAINRSEVAPLFQIYAKWAEAFYYRHCAQYEDCEAAMEEGLKIANDTGVHIADLWLYGAGISAALARFDTKPAKELMDKYTGNPAMGTRFGAAYYHWFTAWYNGLCRDAQKARYHANATVRLSDQGGAPYWSCWNRITLAEMLIEFGAIEGAKQQLKESLELSKHGYLAKFYSANLLATYIAFQEGDKDGALKKLKEVFAFGREHGYARYTWWRPPEVTKMCIEALENNIEIDYARELVRVRKLVPDSPPLHLDNWPWPTKISTFGQFEILKDDEPVTFGRKAPKKPMQLLKAIIAFGGHDVPEAKVLDALK